jgi:hypothetical protein
MNEKNNLRILLDFIFWFRPSLMIAANTNGDVFVLSLRLATMPSDHGGFLQEVQQKRAYFA